jgi:hypothetical protein
MNLDSHALIVVDVQRSFEEPVWGPRNNPACEANIAKLIAAWREHDRYRTEKPVVPPIPSSSRIPTFKRCRSPRASIVALMSCGA